MFAVRDGNRSAINDPMKPLSLLLLCCSCGIQTGVQVHLFLLPLLLVIILSLWMLISRSLLTTTGNNDVHQMKGQEKRGEKKGKMMMRRIINSLTASS